MLPASQTKPTRSKVLLVEDEVLIRVLLAEALREAELCVIEASNAEEAWAWLSSGREADVLFSDIDMPGSISGLDLSRLAKARLPGLPIVLMSGKYGPPTPDASITFLRKPFSIPSVVRLVAGLAGLRRENDRTPDPSADR